MPAATDAQHADVALRDAPDPPARALPASTPRRRARVPGRLAVPVVAVAPQVVVAAHRAGDASIAGARSRAARHRRDPDIGTRARAPAAVGSIAMTIASSADSTPATDARAAIRTRAHARVAARSEDPLSQPRHRRRDAARRARRAHRHPRPDRVQPVASPAARSGADGRRRRAATARCAPPPTTVARFFGARADDLVFVDNDTTGINAVLQSFDPATRATTCWRWTPPTAACARRCATSAAGPARRWSPPSIPARSASPARCWRRSSARSRRARAWRCSITSCRRPASCCRCAR